MGKINIDKVNGFTPVSTDRRVQVKRSPDTAQPLASSKETSEDRLELSARASEVGTLVEKLKELPDVRHEKVNALRVRLAAGDYAPSSDEIADAILKDERA